MNKKVSMKILIILLIISISFITYFFIHKYNIKNNTTNMNISKVNLNGDSDRNNFIIYKNKKINFEKGKSDPENKVLYNEYNLIITDNDTKNSKIVANTFDNNVTLCNNKLYYFVENFENRNRKIFYSYDLDNNHYQSIEFKPQIEQIYSIVSYDNNIYIGAVFYYYETRYGIIKYDIEKHQSTVFSNRDIRYLEDNFIYTGNGFISVIYTNNSYNICFIDLEGNESIKFSTDLFLSEFITLDNNILSVPVLGPSSKGSYLTDIKILKFDINTFELIDEIEIDE